MTIEIIDSDFKSDLIGFLEDGTISNQPSKEDQRISSIAKKWKQEEDDRPLHLPGIRPMMTMMKGAEYEIDAGYNEKEGFNAGFKVSGRLGGGDDSKDKETSSSREEQRDPPDTRDRD
jgi:hypothetical protein